MRSADLEDRDDGALRCPCACSAASLVIPAVASPSSKAVASSVPRRAGHGSEERLVRICAVEALRCESASLPDRTARGCVGRPGGRDERRVGKDVVAAVILVSGVRRPQRCSVLLSRAEAPPRPSKMRWSMSPWPHCLPRWWEPSWTSAAALRQRRVRGVVVVVDKRSSPRPVRSMVAVTSACRPRRRAVGCEHERCSPWPSSYRPVAGARAPRGRPCRPCHRQRREGGGADDRDEELVRRVLEGGRAAGCPCRCGGTYLLRRARRTGTPTRTPAGSTTWQPAATRSRVRIPSLLRPRSTRFDLIFLYEFVKIELWRACVYFVRKLR